MTKKEHKTKEVSQVEVHNIPRFQLKPNKRIVFIFIGLLMLVLLSAGWLFWQRTKSPTKKVNDTTVREPGLVTKDDISSLEKKVSQQSSSKADTAQNYAELGGAYADNNQADKAIAAYQQSLALSANNVPALSGLVYLYSGSGKTQQAIDALNQLIELAKKSQDVSAQADIQKYQLQITRLQQGLDI